MYQLHVVYKFGQLIVVHVHVSKGINNTLKIHRNNSLNKDDDIEVHKFQLCGNLHVFLFQ